MKADEKKLSKFIKTLQAPTCPFCGTDGWTVNETIFQLPEFHNGEIIIGVKSRVLPVISITCDNCGNTYFLNAIRAGLIEPQEQKESDDNAV